MFWDRPAGLSVSPPVTFLSDFAGQPPPTQILADHNGIAVDTSRQSVDAGQDFTQIMGEESLILWRYCIVMDREEKWCRYSEELARELDASSLRLRAALHEYLEAKSREVYELKVSEKVSVWLIQM